MTETQFAVSISASSVVSVIALMMLIAIPSMQWIVGKIPSNMLDELSDDEKQGMTKIQAPPTTRCSSRATARRWRSGASSTLPTT